MARSLIVLVSSLACGVRHWVIRGLAVMAMVGIAMVDWTPKAVSDTDRVLRLFEAADTWRRPLVRDYLTERLARRYAAEGTEAGYAACDQLLRKAPSLEDQGLVVGENVETHDANGLLVLPGGVDVHTHLDWDFGVARTVDTFGTGTQAAAFGGTTTVIDFWGLSHAATL